MIYLYWNFKMKKNSVFSSKEDHNLYRIECDLTLRSLSLKDSDGSIGYNTLRLSQVR